MSGQKKILCIRLFLLILIFISCKSNPTDIPVHNSFTLSGAFATDYSWNYYKFEILLAGNKITLRDTTISDLFKITDVPSGSYSLSVLADSIIIKDKSIIIKKNMSVLIPITGSKPANDLIVFSRGTGYMDDDFFGSWIKMAAIGISIFQHHILINSQFPGTEDLWFS